MLDQKRSFKLRVIIVAVVTLCVWGHIAWDYFHGGIPTHYILHDDALPGIPNWVGGLILPFFTWFLLYRIHRRIAAYDVPPASEGIRAVLKRFLLAFLVAVSISIFFSFEIDLIDYIMLAIILLALVYPLYKSEYLLGWVLGASFTFGAVIPMGFGSLLALVFFVLFKGSTWVVKKVLPKK